MKSDLLKVGMLSAMLSLATTADAQKLLEKKLVDTNFSDWGRTTWTFTDLSTTTKTVNRSFRFSHESVPFTFAGVGIYRNNTKVPGYTSFIEAGKYSSEIEQEPYVETGTIASVTTVKYHHYATGSNRGFKLLAKGDGDADWVVISESTTNSNGADVDAKVNRTNVQLRFENIALAQNAYMTTLEIYGNVDYTHTPILASFSVNGTSYNAADIFEEDAKGNTVGTVEIPSAAPMIGNDNPVTDIVAEQGEVGSVSYAANNDGTVTATIPVTFEGTTVDYKLTVTPKPILALTYYTHLNDQIGVQGVERDAAIGAFQYGEADVAVADGLKFRGWVYRLDSDKKALVTDIVEAAKSLYALVTPIETQSATARYSYTLTNENFDADDHEAFIPEGNATWHDAQHGWDFKPGSSLKLLVGGNATLIFTTCRYSSGEAIITNSKGEEVGRISVPANDATVQQIKYVGGADELTVSFPSETYLHGVKIINSGEGDIVPNEAGYYVVAAGDGSNLLGVLDIVSLNTTAEDNVKIFLPNGTYDLGQTVLTQIPHSNISIIGQSMDGTIIRNAPDKSMESIGKADLFQVGSGIENTYFQDLTLQNALDYYKAGSAGRALAVNDMGTKTIYKNVRMLSYQDTYTNQDNGMFYFEDSEIHGTVDFICGGGEVLFNRTGIKLEPRELNGSGSRTITANRSSSSCQFGYLFYNCSVEDLAITNNLPNASSATWNFGRTWNNSPRVEFINTDLTNASGSLIATRWIEKGMNNTDPTVFGEYNTTDNSSADITPSSNIIKSYGGNFETILTAEEAAKYTVENFEATLGWTPTQIAAQVEAPTVSLNGNTLEWSDDANVAYYAVFNNDTFVAIVTTNSYEIPEGQIGDYTVRAANKRGGFGPASSVVNSISPISEMTSDAVHTVYYNTNGMQLNKAQQGLNIRVRTMANGKTVADKVIVK